MRNHDTDVTSSTMAVEWYSELCVEVGLESTPYTWNIYSILLTSCHFLLNRSKEDYRMHSLHLTWWRELQKSQYLHLNFQCQCKWRHFPIENTKTHLQTQYSRKYVSMKPIKLIGSLLRRQLFLVFLSFIVYWWNPLSEFYPLEMLKLYRYAEINPKLDVLSRYTHPRSTRPQKFKVRNTLTKYLTKIRKDFMTSKQMNQANYCKFLCKMCVLCNLFLRSSFTQYYCTSKAL